jgi:hypothetical protein
LWSAIAADRDSFQGFRTGNLNPLLYLLYNIAPNFFFHDINGTGQVENGNGFFQTVASTWPPASEPRGWTGSSR